MTGSPPPTAQRGATVLIAVDWGTSSLRAARLGSQGEVLEERASPQGILTVAPGQFAGVFKDNFADWLADAQGPVLISGMAGSKQGWLEAPYCPCPAGFDEVAANLKWVSRGRLAIVPGLCCEADQVPDVMRGEEVQIFGAMQLAGLRDGIFVLPGTHSKWAHVSDGRITTFKTYMTGEVFGLLSQQSILAKTVQPAAALDDTAFLRGVAVAGGGAGLLHNAFGARTLSLFNRMEPAALASYLSGLVIAEELEAQSLQRHCEIVLIGSQALTQRYGMALTSYGIRSRHFGSEATWAGLFALSKALQM